MSYIFFQPFVGKDYVNGGIFYFWEVVKNK